VPLSLQSGPLDTLRGVWRGELGDQHDLHTPVQLINTVIVGMLLEV
jgi:hypothetical protein